MPKQSVNVHGAARFAAAALLFWSVAAAQEPMPALRLAHALPPQSIQAAALDALAADVAQAKLARLTIRREDATARAAQRLIERVRAGAIDLAVVPLAAFNADVPPTTFASAVPRMRVFEIPMLFVDERHALRVQFSEQGFVNVLWQVRSVGVEGIGWWPGESLVLAGRKAVLEPSDLHGLRVATLSARASGEPSALGLFSDKLGAVALDVPRSQVEEALASGAIDVLETPLSELRRMRTPKLAVTLTRHLYAGYAVIVNSARWNGLPPKRRDALRDALRDAHDDALRKIIEAVRRAEGELTQERGAALFRLSYERRGQWRRSLESERLGEGAGKSLTDYVQMMAFAPATAARGRAPQVSWNAWFEDGPEAKPQDVTELQVNGVYRFYVDIGRYAYNDTFAGSAGPAIHRLLAGKSEKRLLLQPVLLDSSLAVAPGQSMRPQIVIVNPERARDAAGDQALLKAFDERRLTTRELSRELNLGSFVFWEIKAQAIGCGGIAITVWDAARATPLDHIVLQVPVRSDSSVPKQCRYDGASKAMSTGLQTLLAGPSPAPGARIPDAALHVFETDDDGQKRSQAVLIHRSRLLAALADPKAADTGVYSWQLASPLSSYVSGQNDMPAAIKAAHKAIDEPGRQFPFEDVASELARKVFGGAFPHDRAQAANGRRALEEAIAASAQPTVVVRLISADGATLFVPFGLLAASAQTPVVPKRFTVLQPLAQTRHVASACIGSWGVARPPALQGVSGDAHDLLQQAAAAPPAPGIRVLGDHNALAAYLAGAESGTTDRGEGLIVLAHHDGGYLKFSDADRPPSRVMTEDVLRNFPAGSAAILAACTATGNSPATRAIVERLAQQGVDALIVSPFAVDAEFGTRLALEFEYLVAKAQAERSAMTLVQLFELGASNVAKAYEKESARRDMALEFILIGDPDIKLCVEGG